MSKLKLRRLAAALLTIFFMFCAAILVSGSKESFEYNAQLTRTEHRFSAPLVEIRDCGRACTNFMLSTDHGYITLGNADALHYTRLGDPIEYVVDPEDPDYTIAVGEPEDWEPDATGDFFFLLLAFGTALWLSAWAIRKLIPEDISKLFKRSPTPPSEMSSWGA